MRQKDEYCKPCSKNKKVAAKKNYSLLPGILLALLPKCPFCIMAYSSTVMLCSKDAVSSYSQGHQSPLTIYLTAFFCLLIIAALLLNFRGTRTKYALALSAAGILMILRTVIYGGGQELYYLGVSVVFIAVWLNGSLFYFFRKLRNALRMPARAAAGSARV